MNKHYHKYMMRQSSPSNVNPETDLTVILPTLNEQNTIGGLLGELAKRYPGCSVIVADDGSSDNTQLIVRNFESRNNAISIHFLDRNKRSPKGLTASLLDAFALVRTKYFVVMDADFQHPPEKIKEILGRLRQGTKLIIARREVRLDFPWHRRLISRIGTHLARFILREKIPCSDPLSGFFGGEIDSLRDYLLTRDGFRQQGFKVLFDLLKKLPPHFSLDEIGYEFAPRAAGKSKLGLKQSFSFLLSLPLGEELLHQVISLRFVKFALVGLSGAIVNLELLYILTEMVGVYYIASALISVEVSIISNFLLNNFWTWRAKAAPDIYHLVVCLVKFQAVSTIGLLANLSILWLLTELTGVHYMFSEIVAIGVVAFWNFLANENWTWKGK